MTTKQEMLALLSEFLSSPVSMEDCRQAELDQTEQWYASGQSDYSVYSDPKSLLAAASYTVDQSLTHVERPTKMIADFRLRPDIRTVVDHGCGLGLTTLRLAELYPKALVIGTNVPGPQLEFNQWLLKKHPHANVEFIDEKKLDTLSLENVYLLCLELFEHFDKPFIELRHLLSLLRPVIFAESSSFCVRCTGHFDEYTLDKKVIRSQPVTGLRRRGSKVGWTIAKHFSEEVERHGLIKQPYYRMWPKPKLYLPEKVSQRLWGTQVPNLREGHLLHGLFPDEPLERCRMWKEERDVVVQEAKFLAG